MDTITHATVLTDTGVDALFESPTVAENYNKDDMKQITRMRTLVKLIHEDDDILTEKEFAECLHASRRN